MCGINGIISSESLDLNNIYKMNSAIKHRGPDDEGALKYKNVLLGHVRLSIIDLSKNGKQPMSNDGNLWIVFNGEIYNFLELKDELINLNYRFYSNSDTEVILNAYKEWGVKCFDKFNGMWAIALLDKKKDTIIISRDRYGVKPCYISQQNKKIIFSSEIKGILSSGENYEYDLNKISISSRDKEKFLTTEYKNINIIAPGHYYQININDLSIEKKRWWYSFDNISSTNINYSKLKKEFKEKLVQATNIRTIADTKISTSLSGGIDSAVIFSILNSFKNTSNIELNPFIVKYKGNNTYEEALDLAKNKGRKPIIIEAKEDQTYENLSNILSTLEIINPYSKQIDLYKAQKDHGFKVSIDGHGADESLGGYLNNIVDFATYFQNNLAGSYENIISMYGHNILKDTIKKNGFAENLKKFIVSYDNFIIPAKSDNIYLSNASGLEPPKELLDDIKELQNYSFEFGSLYLHAAYGHLQWLLTKWDKASMSSSVEIRSPFMDWKFFQFCLCIPSEYKIKNGQSKSILRESFKNDLTDKINSSKLKQGLGKQEIYFDEKFNNFFKTIINENDFKSSNYFDSKKIIDDVNSGNNLNSVWGIVSRYLLNKGYQNIVQSLNVKNNSEESYNLLN